MSKKGGVKVTDLVLKYYLLKLLSIVLHLVCHCQLINFNRCRIYNSIMKYIKAFLKRPISNYI